MITCSTLELDLTGITNVDAFIRLTDAPFDVVLSGVKYQAFGSLLKIDKVTTENSLTNKTLNVTLSGLDKQIMTALNNTEFRERPIVITKCFVADGSNVVTQSEVYYRGLAGTPEVAVDYSNGSVTLGMSCKSLFALDQRAQFSRANNSTHQFWFNGDKFFEFANAKQLADEIWRKK